MSREITGYTLSRQWFDFCFENPEKISPNHTALYFFCIEHCNRLGWKEKFGLPMQMAKEAIGIKNYRTYSKTFNDLIEWGFIILVQKSVNQYSSNIIAIAKNAKATTKALDIALQKHSQKQVHGTVYIDKQLNNINKEQENNDSPTMEEILSKTAEQKDKSDPSTFLYPIEHCAFIAMRDTRWVNANNASEADVKDFNSLLEKRGIYEKNPLDYKTHFANWRKSGKQESFIKTELNGSNKFTEQKSKSILDEVD